MIYETKLNIGDFVKQVDSIDYDNWGSAVIDEAMIVVTANSIRIEYYAKTPRHGGTRRWFKEKDFDAGIWIKTTEKPSRKKREPVLEFAR